MTCMLAQAQELQQENQALREQLTGLQATILKATHDTDAWLNKARLAYAMHHTLRQSAWEFGAPQGLQACPQPCKACTSMMGCDMPVLGVWHMP